MARGGGAALLFACLLLAAQYGGAQGGAAMGSEAATRSLLASLSLSSPGLREEILGRPEARRALLQSEGVTPEEDDPVDVSLCLWQPEAEPKCGLNPIVGLDFLGQAPDSPLKGLLLGLVECGLSETREACTAAASACVWIHDQCEAETDIDAPSVIEDCLGREAYVFLELDDRRETCQSEFDRPENCDMSKECSWDTDSLLCDFNVWKFLTGVPSESQGKPVPKGAKQIAEGRVPLYRSALQEANVTSAQEFLHFDAPPFACPPGFDFVVCRAAEVIDALLLKNVYCQYSHTGGECDEEFCTVRDNQCASSAEVQLGSAEEIQEIYLNAIADAGAARIMRKTIFCQQQDGQEDCEEEECLWDAGSARCALDEDRLLDQLLVSPKKKKGVSCQLVQGILRTGCAFNDNEGECSQDEGKCLWDGDQGCEPGPLAYMDILFSNDRDLEVEVTEASFACAQKTSEDDCNSG